MQLSALTLALGRFVSELQRRKVIRVGAGYAVVGWIVLQVALALQTAMKLPESLSTGVVSLLIIGFPVVLVLAWLFEFTPEGIKRTAPASGEGALVKPQTTDVILAGMLALVLVVALAQAFAPRATAPVAATTAAQTDKPKVDTPALGDKSLAVLPFANLSRNDDDAVFADGLTEEVLDVLAHVKGLRVISRTSSFAFKGKGAPLPEIAKQLGVRHILEGSIRRNGDDIRITAQLIDVTTDTHLWSQTFERAADDVFAAQDEIARAVGRALNFEINAVSTPRSAPTKNLEAYRLYLKARGDYFDFSPAGFRESVGLFNRAIALDPHFADARAQLAWVYLTMGSFDRAFGRATKTKARELAEQALKLDPSLATPYVALANLAAQERDLETFWTYSSKAYELDPTNSLVLMSRGATDVILGNFEAAIHTTEELMEIDPLFSGGEFTLMNAAFVRADNAALVSAAQKLRTAKGLRALLANFFLAVLAQERGKHAEAEQFFRMNAPILGNNALADKIAAALKSPAERSVATKALDDEANRNPNLDPLPMLLLIGATDHLLDLMNSDLQHNENNRPGKMWWIWRLVARGEGANPKLNQFLRNSGMVDFWKKHGWPDRCRAKDEDDFECS